MHHNDTAPSTSAKSLLVLSTDSVGRDLLSVILKRRGFRVSEASSEAEARAILTARKFQAVFFDMRPRTFAAHETAEQLIGDFPDQAFVLLADERDELTLNRMMATGAEAVLTHPFEGNSLLRVLSGCRAESKGER